METTDIEKKSLEAHVDLCAQRYRFLEIKLESLEEGVESTKQMIAEVHHIVADLNSKHNDRLINWGVGMIAFLIGCVTYLITTYALK